MARRNRNTVHSLLVLRPALSVPPICHTYRLLISQRAASTNQVTEVNLTRHPRPTPQINLLHHHHPDHTSFGMAIAFLPISHQIQDRNMRLPPQSYRIGSNHYLLYQLPNLRLWDRPIHRPLLRLHHSHQVETLSLRTQPQLLRNPTRKGSHHLGILGKESSTVRLLCIINYLLYQITHRTIVRASHRQLFTAGPLVRITHYHPHREHQDRPHPNIRHSEVIQ